MAKALKELLEAPQEEIEILEKILRKGVIEDDEELRIYRKFVEIKKKLRQEGFPPFFIEE